MLILTSSLVNKLEALIFAAIISACAAVVFVSIEYIITVFELC